MGQTLDRSHFHIFTYQQQFEYKQYRKLKGDVFCKEQSWPIVLDSEGLAEPDTFDQYAQFVGCFDRQNNLLGAVRGIDLAERFPYRDYFAQDMSAEQLTLASQQGFTLNALVSQVSHRGQIQVLLNEGKSKSDNLLTIGEALTQIIFEYFYQRGKTTCYITAMANASDKYFIRHGFSALGDVFTPANLGIALVNMKKTCVS